jgi:hypothetical protein
MRPLLLRIISHVLLVLPQNTGEGLIQVLLLGQDVCDHTLFVHVVRQGHLVLIFDDNFLVLNLTVSVALSRRGGPVDDANNLGGLFIRFYFGTGLNL